MVTCWKQIYTIFSIFIFVLHLKMKHEINITLSLFKKNMNVKIQLICKTYCLTIY